MNSLITAIKLNHLGVVRLLLSDPKVDPSADDNYAIRMASENGRAEIVELLKEHINKRS